MTPELESRLAQEAADNCYTCEQLHALRRGAELALQWQPIETAPRGGRELIMLLTPSGFPQVAYSNTWWMSGFSVECRPTHWLPLPKPQKVKP